jgi:hypothetical protein
MPVPKPDDGSPFPMKEQEACRTGIFWRKSGENVATGQFQPC